MSSSEQKFRFTVEIGGESFLVPIPNSFTVAAAIDAITERAKKRPQFAECVIKDLRLKQGNALLDKDDVISDVARDGDTLICDLSTVESPPSEPVTLLVNTLTGRKIPVSLSAELMKNGTVNDIQLAIEDKEGIPTRTQNLIHQGAVLQPDCKISETTLSNGSTIHLVIIRSEPPPKDDSEEEVEDETPEEEVPAAGPSAFSCPDTLPFSASEQLLTLYWKEAGGEIQELSISLSATMDRLREILVEQKKLNTSNVIADLHLHSHPLLVAKETGALTLAQWGFRELLNATNSSGSSTAPEPTTISSIHKYLSAEQDGKAPEIDTIIYVSFRSFANEAEKYTSSRKDSGDARFYTSSAWQPLGHLQTAHGMNNFLSTLYVVSSHLSNSPGEIVRFLGHFNRRVQFPPATVALAHLIRRKHIPSELKAALSTAFWIFLRKLVSESVCLNDDALFTHSATGFGFLLAYADTADVNRAREILDVSLTCALTQTRLVDPVFVEGSSSGAFKVYNRKSVQDRMEGGSMFVAGSPWSTIKPEQLVVDDLSRLLLLSHPFSEEIVVCCPVRSKKSQSDSDSLAYDWKNLLAAIASDAASSCCNIVPSLSLRSAKIPSLALDQEKRVCVYLGPEPCSVDTVSFLSPSESQTKAVNPALIAKALGSEAGGALVDSRPVQEAIIVCFDVSSSMSGYSFSDDKSEEIEAAAAAAAQQFKPAELHAELQRLREDKYIEHYKRLARKRPVSHWQANVLKQLAETGVVRRALVEKLPEMVTSLLASGELEPQENEEDIKPGVPDRFVRPPDSSASFQIFVKSTSGRTITLDVDNDFTILEIKILMNQRLKTPGRKMRLVYGGRTLIDTNTLGSYGVQANGNLFQEPDLSSSLVQLLTLNILDMFNDSHVVKIRSDRTVFELKLKLWEITGTRPSQFSLWTNLTDTGDGWRSGTLLEDSRALFNYTFNKKIEMDKPYKRDDTRLKRIDTVKQLFGAYINRSQAYNYANQIGLILFGSDVDYACPLTPLFEVFRDHIEECEAEGETCLYDALKDAADELIQFKKDHPDTKLRIIALSDGNDTNSTAEPWDVAKLLQAHNIICDSVLIGSGASNKVLRAIAKSSGGYCFAPKNLKDALKLNELETFLSLNERPDPKGRRAVTSEISLMKFADLFLFPFDVCDDESIPARKMPDAIKNKVKSLEQSHAAHAHLDEPQQQNAAPPVTSPTQTALMNRTRRIIKEISNLMRNPHPAFDIYPTETDIGFWKVCMTGADGSPYKGGTWLLYVQFPETYPQQAPEVRFITPIRHCNINSYGKVCHSIFTRNWTSDTTVATLLSCIYGLLLNPDVDDPLDSHLALQYFDGNGQYEALIMNHVQKYASKKDREAWRKEMCPAEADK